MNRKLMGLVALTLVSILIAACAGPSAGAPAEGKSTSSVQVVGVKATDVLKFEPATLTVKSGTPVRLTLTNDGTLDHDWVVDNLDGKKVQVNATSKTSVSVDFTP